MTIKIKLSEKVSLKLINGLFKEINNRNFVTKLVHWLIDSKYRVYSRLDSFLLEQVKDPTQELQDLANSLKKKTTDTTVINILKWVYNNIKYETDNINYGYSEKWAKAEEVLKRKKDDCDGINSLIYVLARLAGIPSYLLYNAIGDTPVGGHYWLIYLSPINGKLYTIDGTYYPNFKSIKQRIPFIISENRYKKIWYLFNENRIFK